MEPEVEEREWLVIPADLGEWRESAHISEKRVRLWVLVLEASDIPFRTARDDGGWRIIVPDDYLVSAREELRLFEKENRGWPPRIHHTPVKANYLASLSILILLAAFYNITQLDISTGSHSSINWHALGSCNTAKILSGEWWRLITALTLHADVAHLLGNLAIGGAFAVWLCRQLGSGLAWSLILLSGILGNLVNVWLNQPQHTSIGSSTAVFGAVGILAAINALHSHHSLQKQRILPIAAALALLTILGTEGKNTDLGAHLFGFAAGTILGLITGILIARFGHPNNIINTFLAMVGAVIIIGAWWLAIL